MYRKKAQKVIGCEGLTVIPGSSDEYMYFSVMPSLTLSSGARIEDIKNSQKIFYLTPTDYPGYNENDEFGTRKSYYKTMVGQATRSKRS